METSSPDTDAVLPVDEGVGDVESEFDEDNLEMEKVGVSEREAVAGELE
jgi:hypothetical protein